MTAASPVLSSSYPNRSSGAVALPLIHCALGAGVCNGCFELAAEQIAVKLLFRERDCAKLENAFLISYLRGGKFSRIAELRARCVELCRDNDRQSVTAEDAALAGYDDTDAEPLLNLSVGQPGIGGAVHLGDLPLPRGSRFRDPRRPEPRQLLADANKIDVPLLPVRSNVSPARAAFFAALPDRLDVGVSEVQEASPDWLLPKVGAPPMTNARAHLVRFAAGTAGLLLGLLLWSAHR